MSTQTCYEPLTHVDELDKTKQYHLNAYSLQRYLGCLYMQLTNTKYCRDTPLCFTQRHWKLVVNGGPVVQNISYHHEVLHDRSAIVEPLRLSRRACLHDVPEITLGGRIIWQCIFDAEDRSWAGRAVRRQAYGGQFPCRDVNVGHDAVEYLVTCFGLVPDGWMEKVSGVAARKMRRCRNRRDFTFMASSVNPREGQISILANRASGISVIDQNVGISSLLESRADLGLDRKTDALASQP